MWIELFIYRYIQLKFNVCISFEMIGYSPWACIRDRAVVALLCSKSYSQSIECEVRV